ncbi:GOLM1 protein, partial [Amia calva]|nr:GOLM1 protein [Amia calva]
MGGLGNSRRGGRSPPLLIVALIACLVFLGFNYWISNSRNIELQTRVYELEGKVRRAAAERAAVELKKNEFHEQLGRQNEQMNRIESLHQQQLVKAQVSWKEEKENLQFNISSSLKAIQTMKDQLKDLGKLQKGLQECQGNQSSLLKKLTYDMTQCNAQIIELKEEHIEKLSALKKEIQQKTEKKPAADVKAHMPEAVPTEVKSKVDEIRDTAKRGQEETPKVTVQLQNTSHVEEQNKIKTLTPKPKFTEFETNEIPGSDKNDVQLTQAGKEVKNQPEEKEKTQPTAVKEKDNTPESQLDHEDEEETDDLGNYLQKGNGTEEEEGDLEGEQFIQNEQIFDDSPNGEVPGNLDNEKSAVVMGNEPADYNGDEDNVGEFEADKQAELAENAGTNEKDLMDIDI